MATTRQDGSDMNIDRWKIVVKKLIEKEKEKKRAGVPQGRRNESRKIKENQNEKKNETQLVSAITHLFTEFSRYIFSFSIILPRIIHRASYMRSGTVWKGKYTGLRWHFRSVVVVRVVVLWKAGRSRSEKCE
jgi:hypothetical protein